MANVRIDQYPLKPNPVSADYVLIQDSEDLNVDNIRKYKKCLASSMPEVNNNVGSYTYAQLLAIATANELTLGAKYLITNATSASFNLEVEAVSTSAIHCDARDPLYPNDKIMYNFASNVITWRWDTVRDVSAGEDWRNSNNLQIPDSCTHLDIGNGCVGTFGENCTRIGLDNGCIFTIGDDCTLIYAGASSTLNLDNGTFSVYAKDSCNITGYIEYGIFETASTLNASVAINIRLEQGAVVNNTVGKVIENCDFRNNQNSQLSNDISNAIFYYGTDFTTSTTLYALGTQTKQIWLGNDGARLVYLDGSNVMVNVDAEA